MKAAFAVMLLALGLAGCAAESKPSAPAPAVAQEPGEISPGPVSSDQVSYGTIIAERVVAAARGNGDPDSPAGTKAGANPGDVRRSILAAIGAPSAGDPASGSEIEFIIREDGGGTISVVESNEARLRRGERVMIIRGAETRLAPAGQV